MLLSTKTCTRLTSLLLRCSSSLWQLGIFAASPKPYLSCTHQTCGGQTVTPFPSWKSVRGGTTSTIHNNAFKSNRYRHFWGVQKQSWNYNHSLLLCHYSMTIVHIGLPWNPLLYIRDLYAHQIYLESLTCSRSISRVPIYYWTFGVYYIDTHLPMVLP